MGRRDSMICTNCGWTEVPKSTAKTVVNGAATAAKILVRIGGHTGASVRVAMKALGIVLIVIGIPLLLLGGIGLLPIGLGVVLWLLSIFFRRGGRAVAGSMASAPKSCPECKSTGLIPVSSPVARKFMADHDITLAT